VSRAHVALIAAAAAAPRLAALGWERSAITREYVEKSDMIANVFADSGTFGFVPGEPTAYTQPLYALFLTPFHLLGDRHWLAVGLVQVGLAVLTAVLVYAIGLRLVAPRWALAAAVVTTLHPYLVWHDVHLDREILDQPLAAAVTLAALRAASRPSLGTGAILGALLAVVGPPGCSCSPWRWRSGCSGRPPTGAPRSCPPWPRSSLPARWSRPGWPAMPSRWAARR
jgi:4-amino-4-deoxy-L-arabinose transferase-like glycosyltransferase